MASKLHLHNRADGVNGHYCIGRLIGNGPYWEFWNKSGWAGHGQLFTSKEAAEAVIRRLDRENSTSPK